MKKVFILFGSTGNLGSEAVKYFLKQDYSNYYIFSRRPIKAKNIRSIVVDDLTKEENVRDAFNQISRSKNNFYFLLNTIGGYWGGKSIAATPLSDWQKMIDLNLTTSFLIGKYFSILCKSGLGGSLCMISAASAINPPVNKGAYSISKNGINYLTKILALEGKEINLSVNTIAPFAIDTVENREWIKDKTMLVSPSDICILAENLFKNSSLFTSTIFELPFLSK